MLGRLLFDQFALGGLGQCATPGTFPCCTCTTTLCIFVICPSANVSVAGATVTITGFGTCTTNSVGCCQLPGITTGSYAITVVYQGVTIFSGTRTITACHNTNIAITPVPTGFQCCGNCLIPNTLHITDANGTWTAVWTGTTWHVCYTATLTGKTVSVVGMTCTCSASGPISLPIQYDITCSNTTANSLNIGIEWTGVGCTSGCFPGVGPQVWWQPLTAGCNVFSAGPAASDCFLCQPVDNPANPYIDGYTASAPWTTCNPFALSMSVGSGNFTPSPVGGSISVSS